MDESDRNKSILRHIVQHCEKIFTLQERFGKDIIVRIDINLSSVGVTMGFRRRQVWVYAATVVALSAWLSLSASAAQGTMAKPGTFTDTRDGKTYRTAKIGKQVWMAENMNYKPETGKSWCYNDSDSYCEKYGRLYDWETATKVCPAGWHLPSREEWDSLGRAAGGRIRVDKEGRVAWEDAGKTLKAKSGWNDFRNRSNGTDDCGFSALPGGSRDYRNHLVGDRYIGNFNSVGDFGHWWAAAEKGATGAYFRVMRHYNHNMFESAYGKNYGFSVRCVQNVTHPVKESYHENQ